MYFFFYIIRVVFFLWCVINKVIVSVIIIDLFCLLLVDLFFLWVNIDNLLYCFLDICCVIYVVGRCY